MESLNEGGYPLELFQDGDIPVKYHCASCGLVAQNIQLVNCCEERFCLSCIKPHHDEKKPCPICNDEDFDLMSLKKEREKIANLKVCCKEKAKGCEWNGKLKDLHDHLYKDEDGCQFSTRNCPKCHQPINRCDMLHHQENECPEREYQCKYCNYQGSYDNVMRAHLPDCTYCPVVCPNQCGVTCERAQMYEHINDICPEQYLQCEYEYAGCETQYRRKDKDKHMNEYKSNHTLMLEVHKQVTKALKKYEEKRQKERAIEQEKLKREVRELRERIDQLEHQVEQMRQERHHQNHPYQHQAAIGEESTRIRRNSPSQTSERSQSSIHTRPLAINQPWINTIDDFTKLKANKEKWESDIIQTPLGYRLQLNVWPNGQKAGEGTHISVWLGFLNGVYANVLHFPTVMTMKLELHDHSGKWELLKTETFILTGGYVYQFNYLVTFNDNKLISHERIQRRQFLYNDSIKLCVTLLEERICNEVVMEVDDSLVNYQLEGQFLEPYNPQQD